MFASNDEPITATIQEFRRRSGLGRTKIYELLGAGLLESITVGKRRLILLASYRRLIEAQLAVPVKGPTPSQPSRRRSSEAPRCR